MKSKFRTKYDARVVNVSMKSVKSLTDSQYKDDCTIEGIIRRYGVLPSPTVQPVSGDFSEFGDFADNLEKINSALAEFQSLPSSIRARFGNDPRAFFDFVSNPANMEELVKLGLAIERKEQKSATELLTEINDKLSPAKAISSTAESVAPNHLIK